MTKPTLDEVLGQSAPPSVTQSSGVRAAVSRMVDETRPTASRRGAVHPAWLVTAVGLSGLALTAGTLAIDSSVNPDVSIPIAYTTAGGTEVRCTVVIEGGSMFDPGSNVYADYLNAQNWDGVGQRIYDRAVVLAPELANDATAWFQAETELTVSTVPPSLLSEGDHAASDSDCPGRLK
jgi:hypothetical protein